MQAYPGSGPGSVGTCSCFCPCVFANWSDKVGSACPCWNLNQVGGTGISVGFGDAVQSPGKRADW